MNTQMVHFKVKAGCILQFESGVNKIVSALKRLKPAGICYTVYRSDGDFNFIGLLQLDDGVENPLPGIPEAQAFLAGLESWLEGPSTREQLTILANFGASIAIRGAK